MNRQSAIQAAEILRKGKVVAKLRVEEVEVKVEGQPPTTRHDRYWPREQLESISAAKRRVRELTKGRVNKAVVLKDEALPPEDVRMHKLSKMSARQRKEETRGQN